MGRRPPSHFPFCTDFHRALTSLTYPGWPAQSPSLPWEESCDDQDGPHATGHPGAPGVRPRARSPVLYQLSPGARLAEEIHELPPTRSLGRTPPHEPARQGPQAERRGGHATRVRPTETET